MIVGVGIDVVDVRRMRRLLARHPERAAARLFTARERAWCDRRPRADECYAARFAAKEAFAKALGDGVGSGIRWHDVEVSSDGAGKPRLELRERARDRLRALGGRRLHLSLSHDAGVAAAIVLVEGPPVPDPGSPPPSGSTPP